MKRVLVPIADGSEELEAVTIVNVFRRAGAEVVMASCSAPDVQMARGVKITADRMINDCLAEEWDLIALPGGMPGAQNLANCSPLISLLKQQRAANRLYAGICAAPAVVLKPHGLLDGKRATCFPSMQDELADASTSAVVVDGNCITSQGPGTALAFAFSLMELLLGEERMKEVAEQMVAIL